MAFADVLIVVDDVLWEGNVRMNRLMAGEVATAGMLAAAFGCGAPVSFVTSQTAKAFGGGREAILLVADGPSIALPGAGRRTLYASLGAGVRAYTRYRTVDALAVAERGRNAEIRIEQEMVPRLIPPGPELVHLAFPDAAQQVLVPALAAEHGADWVMRVRLLRYGERRITSRGCDKGDPPTWFQSQMLVGVTVVDARRGRQLVDFVAEGRSFDPAPTREPLPGGNGADVRADDTMISILRRRDDLPPVPIRDGVLEIRSAVSFQGAVGDLVVTIARRLDALSGAATTGAPAEGPPDRGLPP